MQGLAQTPDTNGGLSARSDVQSQGAPMRHTEGVQVIRMTPNPGQPSNTFTPGAQEAHGHSHSSQSYTSAAPAAGTSRGAADGYRARAHHDDVPSFELGDGVEIQGTIRVTNGTRLIFNNEFSGAIESNGQVVIGQHGCVRGPIVAQDLVVHGRISIPESQRAAAPIRVNGSVVLESSADVIAGDLHYADTQLEIRRGARVSATLMPHD